MAIFAGGMVTILVSVGLVIDAGTAFFERRDGQNAADLASVAATKVIADHYTKGVQEGAAVFAAIDSNTTANGCAAAGATPCTWAASYVNASETVLGTVTNGGSIPPGAQGVLVSVNRQPATYFLGVLGQSSWNVSTQATALTATITGLPPGQVLPIAVDPPNTGFVPGTVYSLTAGGLDAPGNFSWLNWDGTPANPGLADSICNPNNPAIAFPQWVDGNPGAQNSIMVRNCVDKWITSGTPVLVPLYDEVQGQGNNTDYRVTGLASFVLTWRDQPAIFEIRGVFQGYYGLPSVPAGYIGGPPAPGATTYFLGLWR